MEDLAIPCINDQATNARIRAAQAMRMSDTNTFNQLANFQLGMGLFHLIMNDSWALLGVHRGSLKDPGSLQYAVDLLHHSRVGSNCPDYYTLTSLFDKVLKANILTCWKLECGFDTLESFFASNPSDDDLLRIANNILLKYASDAGLRTHAYEGDPEKEDSLLRNTILLNRDLLLFHELDNAISAGDFGRIEDMLGLITFTFCGAGCTNYTGELLHLLQNLNIVWTPEFACVSIQFVFHLSITNLTSLETSCVMLCLSPRADVKNTLWGWTCIWSITTKHNRYVNICSEQCVV